MDRDGFRLDIGVGCAQVDEEGFVPEFHPLGIGATAPWQQ